MGKILIKSTTESNLLDTLIYYMINEKLTENMNKTVS